MRTLIAAFALAIAAAVPAGAATYDAFASFTGTNTGGAFTYGVLDDTGATPVFTPYSDAAGCAAYISGTTCTSNGGLPAAFKTTSGAHPSGTVLVPASALVLHPGSAAGQSSAILFTAPKAGRYTLSFSAAVADVNPSGVIFEAFSPFTVTPIATLTGTNPSFSHAGYPLTFAAGDTVGFAVNYDGSYYNDSTAINVTLTSVPEPASWALMIAGFGLVGVAARARRTPVAA